MAHIIPSQALSFRASDAAQVAVEDWSCRARSRRMVVLFVATICLSATLLFSVQLLFVKTVLPLFGGTPAVWNTAVFFFQTALLVGYLYVHIIRTYLPLRRQIALHAALMLVACVVLPVHVVEIGGRPNASGSPIFDLLMILTCSIGLPFFVLSATSPLLQSWLTHTKHQAGKDPYFLYAASNVGSMLGLLAYPFALEPFFGLQAQSRLWSGGYLAFIGLLFLTATLTWRDQRDEQTASELAVTIKTTSLRITNRQRFLWALFACIPSSLMLGVTTYLSTAIAPIPMLWMIPLATYLVTLIIAFSHMPILSQKFVAYIPLCAAVVLVLCMAVSHKPFLLLWFIWLHVSIFFVLALMCHRRLAQARPGAENLTEFYLWLSVGGALGGLFNALIAPVIFSNVLEYPLAFCAAVAFERAVPIRAPWRRQVIQSLFFGALAADIIILALWYPLDVGHNATVQRLLLICTVAACLASLAHPRRLALSLAALFGVSMIMQDTRGTSLLTERDFFGVKEVQAFAVPGSKWVAHRLIHNGTVHGIQSFDPSLTREPMGYYGPFGEIITALRRERAFHDVGVVGLGVGTMACYAQAGEHWTFYEIDPAVVRIARDPRYFSYLASCAPRASAVIGDARISLSADARRRYDLMVFDAYSSDQTPVHLLTREALRVYRDNLVERGILVFHISNRSFDLSGVLGNAAADAGLSAFLRTDAHPTGADSFLKSPSVWVVMADSPKALSPLLEDRRWRPLPSVPRLPLWTDDYSSLIRVVKWQ